MRRHTVFWIAAAIAVAGALLIAVLATRDSAEQRLAESPLLGKLAPASVGRDLNGQTVRLTDLRGQWVVLNFFASWCVPCEREHPELNRFHNRHLATGDASVVSVIFDDEVADARRFFEEHGGEWPVIDDPTGKIALDFGVRGPPESFLLAPNGRVAAKIVGEVRDLEGLLSDMKARFG